MPNITALDLLNQRGSEFAQLFGQGQEAQLRNLQMQEMQRGMQEQAQLRSILPQLMQGNDQQGMLKNLMMQPGGVEYAAKIAPVLASIQKDTKTSWQDMGDKFAQLDAYGQPTGVTMPKGAAPKEQAPLEIERLMESSGIQRGSPEWNAGIRRMIAKQTRDQASSAQPYYQFLQTPEGYMAGNARTGGIAPVIVNGRPVMPAQSDPALQGRIAGAKEAGKTAVEMRTEATKSIKKSDQLLAISKQAKDLLDKGPTGSGIGAAVDVAGRVVGYTPESAKIAADLETVSGWMVANVPRMEGPQSNFDVQNYQTMAAKVGDRTVPVKERKSALNTLIALQNKYKRLNQDIVSPQGQPYAPDVDSLLKKYE